MGRGLSLLATRRSRAFRHTHFSGAGHSDLGDFLRDAGGGRRRCRSSPGDAAKPGSGYRSRFDHASEVATPGYYAVTLTDPRRPRRDDRGHAGRRPSLYLRDRARPRISCSTCGPRSTITPARSCGRRSGCCPTARWSAGARRAAGRRTASCYFAMRFSAPLAGPCVRQHREGRRLPAASRGPGRGTDDVAERSGRALVARLDFGALARPLEVKVAISSVDEAGAVANLASEPGDFDASAPGRPRAWRQGARRARDRRAARRCSKSVYTALYHSLLAPSVASDADGRYRGPDNQVHRANGFTFRSTFSLWDTFRAEHPLLTLVQPRAAPRTTSSARWSPAARTARSASCRSGSSRAARPGR